MSEPAKKKTLKERMTEDPGLALIHWVIPDENGPIKSGGVPKLNIHGGAFKAACGAEHGSPGFGHGTGVPRCVTCVKCMDHPLFAVQYEAMRGIAYEDLPDAHRAAIEKHEAANP